MSDVIPSHYGYQLAPSMHRGDGNTLLRIGEVQELVYPTDDRSRSKKFIEYRVLVQWLANDTGNVRMLENCLLVNPLSGLADHADWTLRADKSENRNRTTGLGKGSKVLVLSINGQVNQSVILGGLRDQTDQTDSKFSADDPGHHLSFVFNGFTFSINKDGEATATYGGKTEIDGKRSDSVAEADTGTTLRFTKEGNVSIGDKDGKDAVTIDHKNKKVLIARDQGFEVGSATDKMVKGTTYRDAENSMNTDLSAGFRALQQKLTAAGAALQTAAAACKVPITGPVAAAPAFDLAAQSIIQAVQDVAKMAAAVEKFEAQASKYLSDKDKLGD